MRPFSCGIGVVGGAGAVRARMSEQGKINECVERVGRTSSLRLRQLSVSPLSASVSPCSANCVRGGCMPMPAGGCGRVCRQRDDVW